MELANVNPALRTITFLPSVFASRAIILAGALPAVTAPVRIEGPPGLRVIINGAATQDVTGFDVRSDDVSLVRLEVRNFRDNYERITQLNAELIGLSVDRADRQCRFAIEEQLQFRLVSDESRVISGLYGVVWPVLRIDRRATFVIGLDGRIEDVFHHEVQVYRHLEDVLDRLASNRAPVSAP
jgi:hypothetical protein